MGSRVEYSYSTEGADLLKAALRNIADKDLRTEVNGPIRDAAVGTAERVVVPALKRAAMSGPPQARITAQNIKVRRDRFPKVEIANKSSKFRPQRSPGDRPTFSAIYWGSIKGGPSGRFGHSSGDLWVGPALRFCAPVAMAEHEKAITQMLAERGLL